ncbi:DUF2637 domain-containing protein [Mycolicibacterium arenosum]|uniref:DUF2637 domain-containing protein n=1 Tax=Mycolicibacterium arenosum TaxID=2952157 RepID=A0ABT1MCF8_9MYCO|nr:DUF2637 domain-containing protein [Mycolicibacterium sp. CAU 1645]MCP9276831.1 DUF2637 domain-containing protein [Mycolicibacterium sp. CAU 1645]
MSASTGSWTTAATRVVAVGITAGVGAAGFALSFTALRDLATRGHVPAGQAWLWPLMVDGAIVLATLGVVVMAGDPRCRGDRRFFWAVLIGGAAVSIACNALHAVLEPEAPLEAWLRGCLAAVAPTALLVTTHGLTLLSRLHRRSVGPLHAVAGERTPPVPESIDIVDDADTEVAAGSRAADRDPVRADTTPSGPQVAPDSRWHAVAERVLRRIALKGADIGDVAEVLYLSFEQAMADREVGRRLGVSHHTVSKVVTAGASVLREDEDAVAVAAP